MLQIAIAAVSSLVAALIMYQNIKRTNGEPVPRWMLWVTLLTQKKGNTSEKGITFSVCQGTKNFLALDKMRKLFLAGTNAPQKPCFTPQTPTCAELWLWH